MQRGALVHSPLLLVLVQVQMQVQMQVQVQVLVVVEHYCHSEAADPVQKHWRK